MFVVLIEKTSRGFNGRAKSVMEHPIILYIGKISYGLYVYHNFMLAIVLYYLVKTGIGHDYRLIAPLSTLLTFATAMTSWHLIERPLLETQKQVQLRAPLFSTTYSTLCAVIPARSNESMPKNSLPNSRTTKPASRTRSRKPRLE